MSQIKASVMKALEKIGTTNGHAVPTSQDPSVALVHEYNIATLGESYFKARRAKAKSSLEKSFNDVQKKQVDKLIVSTKQNEVGDSVVLIENNTYILQMKTKVGASFLDVQQLKVELMREHKMTALQVEALIERCTDRREPSKSLEVVER